MIRGLLFDINGTLTDILTNEESNDIYRVLSNFLFTRGFFCPRKKSAAFILQSTNGSVMTAKKNSPNSTLSACLMK